MKRLTTEQKIKWQRLSRDRERNRLRRRLAAGTNPREKKQVDETKIAPRPQKGSSQSYSMGANSTALRGVRKSPKLPRVILVPPANLSLDAHYNEFTCFLDPFRKAIKESGSNIYIDFRKIQTITPGAALVFAAELDRWRRTQKIFLRAKKTRKWVPSVYHMFHEMGLFELLEVLNPPRPFADSGVVKIIKFQSMGTELNPGLSARKFRIILERTTNISVSDQHRKAMYKGLSEAMTNVLSHAYEGMDSTETPFIKNAWWISGDYNPDNQELSVYVYDQGIGIPESFKTKEKWKTVFEDFIRIFANPHDGNVIEKAMSFSQTRTKLEHRGKGLNDIRNWIIDKQGELRIVSGSGELRVTGDGQQQVASLPHKLGGTFIHWHVKI